MNKPGVCSIVSVLLMLNQKRYIVCSDEVTEYLVRDYPKIECLNN